MKTIKINYKLFFVLVLILANSILANAQRKKEKSSTNYPHKVQMWTLDRSHSIKEYSFANDTALDLFQIYDLRDKQSISYSDLGNTGSPYISNIFMDRPLNKYQGIKSFEFLDAYWTNSEKTTFYKTNKPYTWLYYACTPKSRNGQVVDFTHSQNVNEKLNWALNLGLTGSKGRITHQHAKMTSFNPRISYVGKNLKIHAIYNFNKYSIQENGGVLDTGQTNFNRFSTILSTPTSTWGYRNFNVNAEYVTGKTDFRFENDSVRTEIFTPMVSFNYNFRREKEFRKFNDSKPDKGYYEDFFISNKLTNDSLFYSRMTNSFQIKFMENGLLKFSPMLRGEIAIENEKYHNYQNYMYKQDYQKQSNTFFEAGIAKSISKSLYLNGDYRQYLSGRRSGDFELIGNLGYKLYKKQSDTLLAYVNAQIEMYNTAPSMFENNYFSNNYKWNNDFKKTRNLKIGGEFCMPQYHLKVAGAQYLLSNYIYFGKDAMPSQTSSDITVSSISAQKDFWVWHVRFANRFTWQASNNNGIMNLPKFGLYHSTYFDFFLVKNVLKMQIGGQVRYADKYNAWGYAPSTSVFYLDDKVEAGKYPIIDAFFNIKIKGVLMFFQWEHVNNTLIRDYYASTNIYPITDMHFMFGILWRFGD